MSKRYSNAGQNDDDGVATALRDVRKGDVNGLYAYVCVHMTGNKGKEETRILDAAVHVTTACQNYSRLQRGISLECSIRYDYSLWRIQISARADKPDFRSAESSF